MRTALLICAVMAFAMVGAPGADARGGSTIAGAPAAVAGKWLRGSLDGAAPAPCWGDAQPSEFWRLRVRAGDRVRIQWYTSVGYVSLMVYRRDVDDYNLADQSDGYATDQRFANTARGGFGSLRFTAPASGKMPVQVCSYTGEYLGPFRFRVQIRRRR